MVLISWSAAALRDLKRLDTVIAKRIVAKVDWLRTNFVEVVPEPLHAKFEGLYKLRVGGYRVIYAHYNARVIKIGAIKHRSQAYR